MDVLQFMGQLKQDEFVITLLKGLRDGTWLEIGSNHYMNISNTYVLEKHFNWRGIMVEQDEQHLESYKDYRDRGIPIIADASQVDYKKAFEDAKFPKYVDYLQIDIDVTNDSTMKTLESLDKQVMDDYIFRVVTFEHDVYRPDSNNTRLRSREIFDKRGY